MTVLEPYARAIAVAELDGPDAGLAVLDQLNLDHYYHSTRTDLLRRTGHDTKARHAYQRALELAQTELERRFSRTGSANQNRDRSRLPCRRLSLAVHEARPSCPPRRAAVPSTRRPRPVVPRSKMQHLDIAERLGPSQSARDSLAMTTFDYACSGRKRRRGSRVLRKPNGSEQPDLRASTEPKPSARNRT